MARSTVAFNRFGLGARPGDPVPADPQAALLDQLARFTPRPPTLASYPASAAILAELRTLLAERRDARAARAEQPDAAMPDPARPVPGADLLKPIRAHYVGAVGARVATALASDTPFAERLVHFWANHFAVSAEKIQATGLVGAFEFEAIRPHLFGRFADLLLAAERHPAMLLYLDQAQSVGPGSPLGQRAAQRGGQQRKVGLNENLAREILELHTLGVRSGYGQDDVTELARALTGWTVGGFGPRQQQATPGFLFADLLHEPGARRILGQRYGADGEDQGAAILGALAVHPATARHIATKLARHFCADDPPASLVARLEQEFLRTGGDLPALYRVLVTAPEPWAPEAGKQRTPWDWTLAVLRGTGGPPPAPQAAATLLTQLGQQTWKPGSPAGFDDTAASWLGPDALLRRVEAAGRLASRLGEADALATAQTMLGDGLTAATRTALTRAESQRQSLALLFVSPEMLRR